MKNDHRILPFPPQVDTSDLVIGISLDDLVHGVTAAATDLPAPPVQTVVPQIQEKPTRVAALPCPMDEGADGPLFEE